MSLIRSALRSGPLPSPVGGVSYSGGDPAEATSAGGPGSPTAVGTALTIIGFLARRLGSLPRIVVERDDRSLTPIREPDHSVLWDRPAPAAQCPSAVAFWVTAFAHLEGWANVYVWKRYDGVKRRVVSLDLIDPAKVKPRRDRARNLVYRYADVDYSSDEILHIPGLSFDGIAGVPPVMATLSAHQIAHLQERWQRNFYRSAATPSGIISTPAELEGDAAEEFYELWDEQHGGPDGVGGVILLQGGAEYTPVTMSPIDAQLLESRHYTREEILGAYAPGLPHHLLGWKSNTSNFGTGVEQQGIHLVQHVFLPRLELVSDALSCALLPPELKLWWDTRLWVEGDSATQADVWQKMRMSGTASREEWRTAAGLGSLGRPDDLLIPTNTAPVPTDRASVVRMEPMPEPGDSQ